MQTARSALCDLFDAPRCYSAQCERHTHRPCPWMSTFVILYYALYCNAKSKAKSAKNDKWTMKLLAYRESTTFHLSVTRPYEIIVILFLNIHTLLIYPSTHIMHNTGSCALSLHVLFGLRHPRETFGKQYLLRDKNKLSVPSQYHPGTSKLKVLLLCAFRHIHIMQQRI